MLNGLWPVPPGTMLLEDFHGLVEMLNGLGRTYPARRWVESLAAEQRASGFAALM